MSKNEKPVQGYLLVVDDDPGFVGLLEKAFDRTSLGDGLRSESGGSDALDLLMRGAENDDVPLPGLVMLDLHMPVSGREVLEEMKSHPELSSVTVVVLTGSADSETVEEVCALGADDCFEKPSSFDGFIEIAEEIEKFYLSSGG